MAKVIGAVVVFIAGAFADRLTAVIWRALTGKEPPKDAKDLSTAWRDAVLWAALSGVIIAVVRMAATRQASAISAKVEQRREAAKLASPPKTVEPRNYRKK